MHSFLRRIPLILGALALTCLALSAAPVGAQQVNPVAASVKEEQLLNKLQQISGECNLPDKKACTLEQPRGRDWRYYQVPLKWIGASAIFGLGAVVLALYLIIGQVKIANGRSGRVMARFSAFERFVHWMATVCFIILAFSGLNITFGRELILPLVGPDAFATITRWGKYAHNYLSFPFTVSVVMIFLMWIRWNIPSRLDIEWIVEGGGFGKKHPPVDTFNAGQKAIYWVVVLGGGLVAASGYVLMFPFWVTDILGMQIAQLVHAIVGLLFVAAMVFHIYMGAFGEEGALEGMWHGTVDENWAMQHHSVWYGREVSKGNVALPPPEGKVQPAE